MVAMYLLVGITLNSGTLALGVKRSNRRDLERNTRMCLGLEACISVSVMSMAISV